MKIIRLALRSILSFRTYSGINLIGLALSLACFITIFRYVYGEFMVDRFNKNLDRMYVTVHEHNNEWEKKYAGEWQFWQGRGGVKEFTDLLEHPGVENYSIFKVFNNEKIALDGWDYDVRLLVADSNFLKVTDYPLVSGVGNLSEPNSVLITENFAKKLFGKQNPVGKTLQYSYGVALTISGVIGTTSTKATLSFDVIVSYYFSNSWMGIPQTIVRLDPGVDYQTVNKQHESFNPEQNTRYQLFPLSKLYFDKSVTDRSGGYRHGNYNYVLVLMAVGFLILLIGVVNYVNIYTVIVLHRGRELGVKKVFGAGRHNIFLQLLAENFVLTGLALLGAFVFTNAFSPFITNTLRFDQTGSIRFDTLLSFVLLFTLPVIAILFPYFRYCYSTPVDSFSNFGKIQGADNMRSIFLSFQYMVTISMIIVSLFFVKQLKFMMNSEPGYRTNDIIKAFFIKDDNSTHIRSKTGVEVLNIYRKEKQDSVAIEQRMNACPLFTYWTYGDSPNKSGSHTFVFKTDEVDYKEVEISSMISDENWLKIFDIQLLEGRLWDDQIDDYDNELVIVSESFLKLFGISDFSNASLQWKNYEESFFRIAGVIKDYNPLHLSQKSVPVVLSYLPLRRHFSNHLLIASVVPGRMQEAITFLRKLHDETVGGEFNYTLVEDEIREMYSEDRKIASIYSIFTLIAIFVSALGLFSMSLFDIQKRRKEIAIRKINGAILVDIIRLLLKKYFWSLTISFVIAAPIALFAINRYLEGFANKTPVSWSLFAVAFIITAGVSLLTLIYQTRKAANQNPAEEINK